MIGRGRNLIAAVAVALTACSDTGTETPQIRAFEAPVDVAFGCYGELLIGDAKVFTSQPLASCAVRALGAGDPMDPNPAPPGQEEIKGDRFSWYVLAVQPTAGSVTVVDAKLNSASEDLDGQAPFQAPAYQPGEFSANDADPLIPGHNSLAVGATPVAISTDTAGCHVLTANADTCDLSVIDLQRLAENDGLPIVSALDITAGGQPLLARPAAMAATDLSSPIGVACPATPVGIHYIAYPECHAVAAVDGATGAVVASIRFAADGTATIGDGNLVCPRQCFGREPVTDGARPVALDIAKDDRVGTQKLAIALANRPVVTVVTLDGTGRPATVAQADLEGAVGVTDVAITKQITMGGVIDGLNDGDAGDDAQFVYAVATDGTVRVAEMLVANHECETQVDPRYLLDEQNSRNLICMGVGAVGTPPRRARARGPGIEVAAAARPVAVAVSSNNNKLPDRAAPNPAVMAGHFAFVTLSNGFTVTINIDDDNIADTHLPASPLASAVPLVLPHQVRDAVSERGAVAVGGSPAVRNCAAIGPDNSNALAGGPRSDDVPGRVILSTGLASTKGFTLPYFRQGLCVGGVEGAQMVPLPDTMFPALDDIRVDTFPDLRAMPVDEDWTFTWQGTLSGDRSDGAVIDGPIVRTGLLDVGGGGIALDDAAAPYCAAGVEPGDIVTLRGCDPARGDAQCGVGETCYVHPDATVATGACLPTDQVDALAGRCRDYLVSIRRYAVVDAFASRLTLRERRRELRTTPIGGCTSTQQCQQLAEVDARLLSSAHPKDDTTPAPTATYACEPDPYRATGESRCFMTCERDDQCADGTLCRAGHCIEGIVPAPECTRGLQRYDLRAGDAFVALGSRTGYLHGLTADPATRRCRKDPTAHPLLAGRIPLSAPPCTGTGPTDLSPNPCSLTVEHTETVPNYTPGTCEVVRESPTKLVTRTANAIRFRNPFMNLTLVDPTYPGDAMCLHDRAGTLTNVPTVFTDARLVMHVTAGFQFLFAGGAAVQPANVVRAPDNSIWIVDSGDIDDLDSDTPNLRGQLIRVSPDSPTGAIEIR